MSESSESSGRMSVCSGGMSESSGRERGTRCTGA